MKYFVSYDDSSVDFYWNKYEKIFEQRRGINYSFYVNRNLTFAESDINIYILKIIK